MSSFTKFCAFAAVAVVAFGSMVMAQDSARSIDQEFNRTSAELNQELDRATNQIHEAERNNQSSSVANRYGSAADIDRQIQRTVDDANDELNRATRQIQRTENLGATPIQRNESFRSSFDSINAPAGANIPRTMNETRATMPRTSGSVNNMANPARNNMNSNSNTDNINTNR